MTSTQRTPRRYPIRFQLRYKAISKHGTLHGFGQSGMMSSKEIIFAPGEALEPGMKAEIAVAWPFLLDGQIRLQLVLETTITGSHGGVAEARILTYHFRTRRSAEAERREEPVHSEAPPPAVDRELAAAHA